MEDDYLERGPAAVYEHQHPPVRNVNESFDQQLTYGQRIADRVASVVGSWPFIIVQTIILIAWIIANVVLVATHRKDTAWDPYPFILLNLVLSFQAAYTGPIVMMSQNRQAEKDRLMMLSDYETNVKAEEEIKVLMRHLIFQDGYIAAMREQVRVLENKLSEHTNTKES